MAKLVSKVYGEALFELACERDEIQNVWEESKALLQLLDENKELQDVMNHPSMSAEAKRQLLEKLLKDQLSNTMMGFLDILVRKGRFSELQAILAYYDVEAKEHFHVGVAYVSTAVELDQTMKEKVEKKLLSLTEYETFEMHYIVDKELIGGMVIRIGDRVLDDSIRHKLDKMSAGLNKLRFGS